MEKPSPLLPAAVLLGCLLIAVAVYFAPARPHPEQPKPQPWKAMHLEGSRVLFYNADTGEYRFLPAER